MQKCVYMYIIFVSCYFTLLNHNTLRLHTLWFLFMPQVCLAADKTTGEECALKIFDLREIMSVEYDVNAEISVLELGRENAFVLGLRGFYTDEVSPNPPF